MNAISENV